MTEEAEHLIALYKTNEATLSEKRKAEMERDIWALVTAGEKRVEERATWLSRVCGVTYNAVRCRAEVLAFGSAAEVLWERIDKKKLHLCTARQFARKAGGLSRQATMGEERLTKGAALQAIIDEYDHRPRERVVNGVPTRTSVPVRKEDNKSLWVAVGELVTRRLSAKFKGLDAHVTATLISDFERDIKIATDDLQRRILREQSTGKEFSETMRAALTRTQLVDACAVLILDPPVFGKPIDLEKAGKQKRQLARQYHPDANEGQEHKRALYEAVINAYNTLENYAAMYNSKSGGVSL